MKNIVVLIAFTFIVSGCASLSKVTFHTQPPGGKIKVEGVTEPLEDGESIDLEEGVYAISSQKEGYSGLNRSLAVDGKKDLVVTVPLGSGFSKVTATTEPPGEKIKIRENGVVVEDGETISLPPGAYTFLLEKEGYRDSVLHQEVDGFSDFNIVVSRGKGIGMVSVSGKHDDTVIEINNEKVMDLPVSLELEEGKYQIRAKNVGYYPDSKEIVVTPGSNININFSLKRIPTSGSVSVTTNPSEAKVFFNGREVGKGKVELGSLPFGKYKVKGEYLLNSLTRRVGETVFSVKKPGKQVVQLNVDQQQYLYEKEWLPLEEAKEREEQRYHRQRVAQAIAVNVAVDLDTLQKLNKSKQLAEALHAVLRVGDRVNFSLPEREVLVWKRHSSLTPEFVLKVSSLLNEGKHLLNWQEDPPQVNVTVSDPENIIADIAIKLHRSRTDLPLVELTQEQLSTASETVFRNTSDGELTLVISCENEMQVDGKSLIPAEGVAIVNIPADSSPVVISWHEPPEKILLVSEKESSLTTPKASSLKMNEKKLIRLASGKSVDEVIRLSAGPEYSGWQRKVLQDSGPLSGQIDLSVDEIGPHGAPGTYQRIWLVRYSESAGESQRQIGVEYKVGDELNQDSTNIFLRRAGESQ